MEEEDIPESDSYVEEHSSPPVDGDVTRQRLLIQNFIEEETEKDRESRALDEKYARNFVKLLAAEAEVFSDEEADETKTQSSPDTIINLLRAKTEERTKQLNDARKDLWTVTIQCEELEENFNQVHSELREKVQDLNSSTEKVHELQAKIADLEEQLQTGAAGGLCISGGSGDGFQDSQTASSEDHSKMIEYVRTLETDLSQKEWSIRAAGDEIRSLRFVMEETNYCKANLEQELIAKSDLLNKSDYGAHVLRSLLDYADQQRKQLEESLVNQTVKMLGLREQLEECGRCTQHMEQEAAKKDECLLQTSEELQRVMIELEEWKLALREAQGNMSQKETVLQERIINQLDMAEELKRAIAETAEIRSSLEECRATMKQLENQLLGKDTQCQQATDDAARLSHELQRERSQTLCLKAEVTSVTAELERVTAKHQAVQLELATVKGEKWDIASQLDNAKNLLTKVEEESELLRVELKKTENNKTALEKDLTDVFDQTRQINHEKVFLRSQLERERKYNSEMEEQLEASAKKGATEISELNTSIGKLQETIQLQAETIADRDQQLTRLTRLVSDLQDANEQLKENACDQLQELTEAEEIISLLREDMDALRQAHKSLEQDLTKTQRESEDLHAIITSHQDANCHLVSQKAALEDRISTLVLERTACETELQSLRQTVDDLERSRQDNQERFIALQEDLSHNEARIADGDQMMQALRDETENVIENLQAQLNKSQAERFQAENDIAFFRSKIADFETDKEAAQATAHADLQTSRKANEMLHVCLEKLTSRAEQLQSELEKATNVRQTMEKELGEVNLQLETLNAMLENAVSEDGGSLADSSPSQLSESQYGQPLLNQADDQIPSDKDEPPSLGSGDTEQVTLFNTIAESKSLLEKQLQEKKRECELAQAEIAALRSNNSCLEMRQSDIATNVGTQHEALMAAAVELAAVRECLREDLLEVQESSRKAASDQERLLNEIRQDLGELSTGLLRKNFGPSSEQEQSFRIMVQKLTDFTNVAVHTITNEAEKSSSRFRKLLRRNVQVTDAIIQKVDQLEHSTIAFELLAFGAQNYTEMTKELKKVLRSLDDGSRQTSTAIAATMPVRRIHTNLEKHLRQLHDFLDLIRHSPEVANGHADNLNTKLPLQGKRKKEPERDSCSASNLTSPSSHGDATDEDPRKIDIGLVRERLVRANEELKQWRFLAGRRRSSLLQPTQRAPSTRVKHSGTTAALSKETTKCLRKALVDGCTCALGENESQRGITLPVSEKNKEEKYFPSQFVL
ncbi:hypothetical protein BV898_08299 [Hypsibius exemplaris]|uniref:Uncharacterized protein n=1 Tax=Hypsibius exemplaris TaxID=2072580 RepID=A0A1W0WR86_HYPEX|nr:hypothetical protein BV898_08299 [Hypsibius exemplaris]